MVLCHRHILTNHSQSSRFITERSVSMLANTADNTLNLTIGTTGRQAIYAYRDSTVVGKVNVQAYSYKDVKVHLVRVNGATKRLDVEAITKGVNEIFDDAVVRYTFDELDPITINYANKEHFVHGGKGTFQNYNEDQKTAIKALPETADQNDYYLFFVECSDRLDTAGNKSKDPVCGYMPVGRHYGFIYNEYTNARNIAHELAHGTNALHHTFSPESETFYTTKETDNLMDYHAGTTLTHTQWQWSHEKHRNVLGFLDDEGESEAKDVSIIVKITEAENTNYGFDVIEGSSENYISVESGNKTTFYVSSKENTKLYFGFKQGESKGYDLLVDSVKFSDKYVITIESNNDLGSTSVLQIYVDSINGFVAKELIIKSYKRVDTDMYIYGINCDASNINKESIQKLLNCGVIRVRDFEIQNCIIEFDVNQNGALDIYTEGDNPEKDLLLNSDVFSKSRKLSFAIIGCDIHRSYRLKRSISQGDTILLIKHNDDKLRKNQISQLFIDTNLQEIINIKRVSGDTLYLKSAITNDYPESVIVWRKLSGLSSSPQIVKLKSKDVNRVLTHERLHRSPFNLLDLDDNSITHDNIMLYYDSIGQNKLRNRELKVRGKNTFEKQWDKIKR